MSMYTKYGKSCRHEKSSKSSDSEKSEKSKKPDDPEESDNAGEDDTAKEHKPERRKSFMLGGPGGAAHDADDEDEDEDDAPYRKGSSRGKDGVAERHSDGAAGSAEGGESEGTHDVTESSDEQNAEGENDVGAESPGGDNEGGENEGSESGAPGGIDEESESDAPSGIDEDGSEATAEESDESSDYGNEAGDEETVGEEASADSKKGPKVRPVLEYDIKDMYPEINILVQKKKKEWDFQDPDIIRAIWLETKTQALSEWKVRNAKIKINKPSFEVRETLAFTLRQEHLKNKVEQQKAREERDFEITAASRDPPHFDAIQLATNITTDMRYKYNRNNPPVPSHYIEHFEKFKKPPFKNNSIWYVHS